MTTVSLTKLQHRQIDEKSESKLQALQRKLYLKAKQNPQYKFYCLYDKVFRMDTLTEAYRRVKANKGAPGVDRLTFQNLEGKEEQFLKEIQQKLQARTYTPTLLRAVSIPKANGKTRTLRIPTINDRVVQMAVTLIINPIFEADFQDTSYAYRPKRGAHDAIATLSREMFRDIYRSVNQKRAIQNIDLSNCFETIPHAELLQRVARRIIDRQLLKVIKSFLTAGTMGENNEQDASRGTPQGGVISPLLANIYLDPLDRWWKEHNLQSIMLRYADDMVILLHPKEERQFQLFLQEIEQEHHLILNRDKCTRCTVQEGTDFLGFMLQEKTSRKKKRYLAIEPSKKALSRCKAKLRSILKPSAISTAVLIEQANIVLCGWQQYFDNTAMGKTRQHIQEHVERRCRRLISKRNKRSTICWKLFKNNALFKAYGLHTMKSLGRSFTLKT